MQDQVERAAAILTDACAQGQVRGAVLAVRWGAERVTQVFGETPSVDVAFLLGSISKPIVVAAVMILFDQGRFGLDDLVRDYLPEFTGEGRDQVTVRHVLTHVSGLPDQLPENAALRQGHAPLSAFVEGACRVPLGFAPGTRYEYSSMAILLAAELAQRLTGVEIRQLVAEAVLLPLGMYHSALGLGELDPALLMPCQVEHAAIEAGGGAPGSEGWDWNSPYWRALGSPWGGVHASAGDVLRFLDAFLHPHGELFRPEVAQLMVQNHNPEGLKPRGLGFDLGLAGTERSFGHTGSTGTHAWADPERDLTCVVLTTLPTRAVTPHPTQLASDYIAAISATMASVAATGSAAAVMARPTTR
ncbi:serine hydrolase domain-containing protein [Armatimonas rosea]|uniref:CubicO group peptidase (Beta-lactamase class C family) n=1 Tax=Armatimonas rosea TaxID=685828 RepID=A0A7W9SSS9_ARMRO|nr:serine hydrolase domain-containing protein [Armatimonas rosea]MBB6051388.1 CubicO group peptidase (beta-lactamase class C family) [Armatimonas rosea]